MEGDPYNDPVLIQLPSSASAAAMVLTEFTQDDTCVKATIENVDTLERRGIETSYLVGADGARSTVRRALGIRHSGETGVQRDFFGGKMVALHLRVPDFYRVMPHPRAWMYWAFNTERRSWLAAVNGQDEFAFHTQLKPGEDENVDPDRARSLFQQVMGMFPSIVIHEALPARVLFGRGTFARLRALDAAAKSTDQKLAQPSMRQNTKAL